MKATITALSYREENPIGIALKITGAIIIVVGLIVGFFQEITTVGLCGG